MEERGWREAEEEGGDGEEGRDNCCCLSHTQLSLPMVLRQEVGLGFDLKTCCVIYNFLQITYKNFLQKTINHFIVIHICRNEIR